MFIGNPFNGAFGLDIGDLSLKLVQLSLGSCKRNQPPQYILNNVATIALPPGYIVDGEIQQPEMVRKKLLQLLGKEGSGKKIFNPYVVADLPEPKTFLTSIEIQLPPESITKEDVEFQCVKHLPFDLKEAYIDWQISPGSYDNVSTRVLVGAVPRTIADSYTYLLESADLQPIALEVETMSIVRSLIQTFPAKSGAILDIGATRSAIIVYDSRGVCFSTSLPYSGELLNTALSQKLKIEYQAAEEMKVKNGLNFNKDLPDYLLIVDELTNKLTDEIKKVFVYYQDHFSKSDKIEKMEVCGGMTMMPNFLPTLSRRLEMECNAVDAWKFLNKKNISADNLKNGHVFVSALGLAMRATLNPYKE